MTTTATTGCSGSASRRPSRAARRSRRSATPSSAGRSGDRTSTSPKSRSRSTIRPTTGSPSARRPGSRSARPGDAASEARASRAIGIAEVVVARRPAPRRRGPRARHRARPPGRHLDGVARTTVTATACSTSTPTCRTSGWPIGRPRREPLRRRRCSTPPIPAIEPSSTDSWRRRAGRACGCPTTARPGAGPSRITDLRGARDLPVLIVAGVDPERRRPLRSTRSSPTSTDGVIGVDQPAELDGATGTAEDYTVAILNRGMPSFNVEADGSLYLSIMRSCSGWPSGVWIDPPRRSTPDGANFQFQHWSHTFEYAIAAGVRRLARRRDRARRARLQQPARRPGRRRRTPGDLPATASFVEVEPASVVLTVLKPGGVRGLAMAGMELDPADGVALRLYESSGRPDRGDDPDVDGRSSSAARTEPPRGGRPSRSTVSGSTARRCDSSRTRSSTVAATLEVAADAETGAVELGPARRGGPAGLRRLLAAQQGCGADGLPVRHASRSSRRSSAATVRSTLPIVVASERTDGPAPDPWRSSSRPAGRRRPSERIYRLAPGAHLAFDASVRPAAGASPGRYFVAARIVDEGGPDPRGRRDHRLSSRRATERARSPVDGERSAALGWAVERALTTAGDRPEPGTSEPGRGAARPRRRARGRAARTARSRSLRETAARSGSRCRTRAASEIRGEAQILSPLETWTTITPWTQGFAVEPGGRTTIEFDVEPPRDVAAGTYWALVKVMYFGRVLYSESVPVTIRRRGRRARAGSGGRALT